MVPGYPRTDRQPSLLNPPSQMATLVIQKCERDWTKLVTKPGSREAYPHVQVILLLAILEDSMRLVDQMVAEKHRVVWRKEEAIDMGPYPMHPFPAFPGMWKASSSVAIASGRQFIVK
jgi:hypothetical protein